MKLLAVIIAALILATVAIGQNVNPNKVAARCKTGQVRGFAAVIGEPRLGGVGAIPNDFTKDGRFFGIRYNCTKRLVFVKRIGEGQYDVMFPANPARVAVVSALSSQAIATSVYRPATETFRVSLRGPLVEQGILVRRDIEFYIAIF